MFKKKGRCFVYITFKKITTNTISKQYEYWDEGADKSIAHTLLYIVKLSLSHDNTNIETRIKTTNSTHVTKCGFHKS